MYLSSFIAQIVTILKETVLQLGFNVPQLIYCTNSDNSERNCFATIVIHLLSIEVQEIPV